MIFEAATFSHIGGRLRNDDRLLHAQISHDLTLFLLADGSGDIGGDAAATAVAGALQYMQHEPNFSTDDLRHAFVAADQAVCTLSAINPTAAPSLRPATTMVAALVDSNARSVLIANIGDSRAYHFHRDQIKAVSRDHSLVQRYIDVGLYPAGQLRSHPRRHVLYAALGMIELDISTCIHIAQLALEPGDALMLCSDGVWQRIDEPTMLRLQQMSDTTSTWCRNVVSAVRGRMAPVHDNFSAVVLRCHDVADAEQL